MDYPVPGHVSSMRPKSGRREGVQGGRLPHRTRTALSATLCMTNVQRVWQIEWLVGLAGLEQRRVYVQHVVGIPAECDYRSSRVSYLSFERSTTVKVVVESTTFRAIQLPQSCENARADW